MTSLISVVITSRKKKQNISFQKKKIFFLLCNRKVSIEICQLWKKCQAHLTVFDKRSEFVVVLIDPHKRRRL